MSRYVVGIDLGTTNSALAYVDTAGLSVDSPVVVTGLAIEQVVAAGEVGARPVLPSFVYLAGEGELGAGALDLPWKKKQVRAVGQFARDHGARVPDRLVSSAKSWLCHPGADRRGPILPWHASDNVARISPVEASAALLGHLREVWNHSVAGKGASERLENQEVLLTVPASFDAVARELTVDAARQAGLENVTLLEEPQAAFYAWLAALGEDWRKQVRMGDRVLVCDVGGGTTDFTLIAVSEEEGNLILVREAVGEHILLGGDNMDLALAYAVGAGLPGGMESLDATQRIALTYACRGAKEQLFQRAELKSAPISVLGRGSKVIGGSTKTELSRELLQETLLDGFFPMCQPADQPGRGRRAGLAEIGLPYASDAAITRHLARFLNRQGDSLHEAGSFIKPTAVLYNGGVFQAAALRERVRDVLSSWRGEEVPALESADLDLAVARGAAYYGMARRGRGVRIRGGVPRAYYIGIEVAAPAVPGVPAPIKALCVVPHGMEEGTALDVPSQEFGLVVGEPAVFRFFSSTTRRDDAPGTLLERWQPEELQELEPLETALAPAEARAGQTVPVRLHSHVTEVGTLDLSFQDTTSPERWKLEFDVREPEGRS